MTKAKRKITSWFSASPPRPKFATSSSQHALLTKEWTPLEPGVLDHKLYVRGVGMVLEQSVKGHRNAARSSPRQEFENPVRHGRPSSRGGTGSRADTRGLASGVSEGADDDGCSEDDEDDRGKLGGKQAVDGAELGGAQHEQGSEAAKHDDCSERELPPGEGRAGSEIDPRNGGEWSSVAKWKGPVEDSARLAAGQEAVSHH